VNVTDHQSYPVLFEPLQNVPELLLKSGHQPGRVLVVTDENVGALYAEELIGRLSELNWRPRLVTLPPGESTKSMTRLSELYDSALTWNIDRQTPVLALGGGVIGDIAGFAASTLLRGLPLVQLPTTLLAQVDSSIGGKTGINHESGKNLIGSFYQPAFVCSDPITLKTLPEKEWTSGLSEVVKHALIADPDFLDWLDENLHLVLARDEPAVATMIARAARIKATIVSLDERDTGVRATLNFGHTFAHALEKVCGYGRLTHGEAVLVGLKAAVLLSGKNSTKLDVERSMNVLSRLPMPSIPESLAFGDLIDAMRTDKKRAFGNIRFVLLREIGEAYITSKIDEDEAEMAWKSVFAFD